jgi:hypothetical protein
LCKAPLCSLFHPTARVCGLLCQTLLCSLFHPTARGGGLLPLCLLQIPPQFLFFSQLSSQLSSRLSSQVQFKYPSLPLSH